MSEHREHHELRLEDSITLTDDVSLGIERGLTELRLAILGILIAIGLGAAGIGLFISWWAGLVGGLGSAILLISVLKVRRLRRPVMRFMNWLTE